jgi:hypothetical protein
MPIPGIRRADASFGCQRYNTQTAAAAFARGKTATFQGAEFRADVRSKRDQLCIFEHAGRKRNCGLLNEGLRSRVEEQNTEWEDTRRLRSSSLKVFPTAQAARDLNQLESRFETEIASPSTWSPVRLVIRTSHSGVQALHELLQGDVVQSIKTMKSRPGSGASHHPMHQSVRKLVGRSVVIYYEVSKDRIDILRFGKPQNSQP